MRRHPGRWRSRVGAPGECLTANAVELRAPDASARWPSGVEPAELAMEFVPRAAELAPDASKSSPRAVARWRSPEAIADGHIVDVAGDGRKTDGDVAGPCRTRRQADGSGRLAVVGTQRPASSPPTPSRCSGYHWPRESGPHRSSFRTTGSRLDHGGPLIVNRRYPRRYRRHSGIGRSVAPTPMAERGAVVGVGADVASVPIAVPHCARSTKEFAPTTVELPHQPFTSALSPIAVLSAFAAPCAVTVEIAARPPCLRRGVGASTDGDASNPSPSAL